MDPLPASLPPFFPPSSLPSPFSLLPPPPPFPFPFLRANLSPAYDAAKTHQAEEKVLKRQTIIVADRSIAQLIPVASANVSLTSIPTDNLVTSCHFPDAGTCQGMADGLTWLSLPQLELLTGHCVCDLSQHSVIPTVDVRYTRCQKSSFATTSSFSRGSPRNRSSIANFQYLTADAAGILNFLPIGFALMWHHDESNSPQRQLTMAVHTTTVPYVDTVQYPRTRTYRTVGGIQVPTSGTSNSETGTKCSRQVLASAVLAD